MANMEDTQDTELSRETELTRDAELTYEERLDTLSDNRVHDRVLDITSRLTSIRDAKSKLAAGLLRYQDLLGCPLKREDAMNLIECWMEHDHDNYFDHLFPEESVNEDYLDIVREAGM